MTERTGKYSALGEDSDATNEDVRRKKQGCERGRTCRLALFSICSDGSFQQATGGAERRRTSDRGIGFTAAASPASLPACLASELVSAISAVL